MAVGFAAVGSELQLRRPLLRAMEHRDEFQALASNAVGDDVGGVGHDKFARSEHSPRATDIRLDLEELDSVENAERDE